MRLRIRLLLLPVLLLIAGQYGYSQCASTDITGDLIISADQELTGTYNVSGLFQIDAGITVTVTPFSTNGCGEFSIYAASINIQGNINADFAGYAGGVGGGGSTTGTNIQYLTSCNDKDNCYAVNVNGGLAGSAGSGTGGGNSGLNGGGGIGPKQKCENIDDTYGLVGGAGGGGGGGGGSYGANAGTGGNGGAGVASGSFSGMSVSSCAAPAAGSAGNGGGVSAAYGTLDLLDIEIGSGGAGAGGGGKSYYDGTSGGAGGAGGGKILLSSTTTLIIAGTLSAQGSTGLNGGNGGAGGKTSRCCSDACDGCDETTYSAGAGGGGGAGGGAGGGILLQASDDLMLTGTLRAEGGNGGLGGQGGAGASPCNYGGNFACNGNSGATNAGATGTMGGGGSGGRIKVFQNPCRENVLSGNILLNGGNGNGGAAETGTINYGNIFGVDIPTLTANATNITCAGETDGMATANAAGGLQPYSYLWTDGNAQTTQVASGLSAGDYTVTITDDNGCSVSATATIAEPEMLSLSAVVTNPCSGGTGSIDLTTAGGTPAYTFSWLPNGETTDDLTALAEGTYDITVMDANGCEATGSYTVTAITLTITPDVHDETCAGLEDGSIDLTVSGGSGNYTYLWSGSETTQNLSSLAAGPYDVTVTDTDNSCTATQSFTIQSGPSYTATITQDGDTLTSSVAVSYQWYLNGVLIENATSQTYTIIESGTYYCVVTNQSCEFTSNSIEASCICSIPIGITDNPFIQGVSVYPNPATQVINVVLNLNSIETVSVSLIDLTGRKLWHKEETEKGFAWKIPVTGFTAGNYFVQITVCGKTKNVKVLVK